MPNLNLDRAEIARLARLVEEQAHVISVVAESAGVSARTLQRVTLNQVERLLGSAGQLVAQLDGGGELIDLDFSAGRQPAPHGDEAA